LLFVYDVNRFWQFISRDISSLIDGELLLSTSTHLRKRSKEMKNNNIREKGSRHYYKLKIVIVIILNVWIHLSVNNIWHDESILKDTQVLENCTIYMKSYSCLYPVHSGNYNTEINIRHWNPFNQQDEQIKKQEIQWKQKGASLLLLLSIHTQA
jgi:hypothetical protein